MNARLQQRQDPGESQAWWQWTEEHVAYKLDVLKEALGQALGLKCRDLREEIASLRRELTVLREEVAVERKLKSLQSEIVTAQAAVLQLPAVEAQFEVKQAETRREVAQLKRELAAAKDRIATLNVEASQTRYVLNEIEKRTPPTIIDPQTLEKWRQCIEQWLKQHEEPEPLLLLPAGHTLPLEQGNGAPPSH